MGERIRTILLDHGAAGMGAWTEVFLYMAARAQLVEEVIRPALDAGRAVVSDRYLLSSIVYQGIASGIGAAIVEEMGNTATRGLRPDLTLVIDLEVEDAFRRRSSGRDRMESKGQAFHELVRQGYIQAAAVPVRRIRMISGTGTPDEVEARVRPEIDRVLL